MEESNIGWVYEIKEKRVYSTNGNGSAVDFILEIEGSGDGTKNKLTIDQFGEKKVLEFFGEWELAELAEFLIKVRKK